MTLHIWSRIHCRWEIWRGTLAVWKALPHAVVGAGCTVALTAVVLHHIHGPKPAPLPAVVVPAAVYLAGLPHGPTLRGPSLWTPSFAFVGGSGGYGVLRKCDHDRDDPKSCRKPRSVPEPATWGLLAAGILMVWAAIRRRTPAPAAGSRRRPSRSTRARTD